MKIVYVKQGEQPSKTKEKIIYWEKVREREYRIEENKTIHQIFWSEQHHNILVRVKMQPEWCVFTIF